LTVESIGVDPQYTNHELDGIKGVHARFNFLTREFTRHVQETHEYAHEGGVVMM
jgi:hypothetical protein